MGDNLFDDDDQPAPARAGDMRSKLAELAARKRKEQEEVEDAEEAAKAAKRAKKAARQDVIDFGDSDEDEEQQQGGEEEAPAPQQAPPPEVEEEDERAYVRTAADDDFIDDTGLEPEERIDFAEEDAEQAAQLENAQEALEEGEEDELDRIFGKGKRKDPNEMYNEVEAKRRADGFLAQMEVAIEEDQRDYEAGRPAINKLRLLPQLEEIVSVKRLHGELLDSGILGVLKGWLEPMQDGTLPNVRVREAVLRTLATLPIDCSKEDRKDQLKRSGLGRLVMFLFKLPDETAANRRLAKNLIEAWSRPILAAGRRAMDADEEARIMEARRQRQARQAALEAERGEGAAAEEDEDRPPPRKGDPGFRWHAAIPQAASLDYVRMPQGMQAPEGKGRAKEKQHKLSKKLETISKAGTKSLRAANVSVEGRNVVVRE